MATTKTANKNAFIDLGVIDVTGKKGVVVKAHKYIVIPERFAKYMSATHTTTPPASRKLEFKRGQLTGRTITREFVAKLSGRKYEFGYYDGTKTSVTGDKGTRKIKWIPVHVPRGITLFVFLKAFIPKIARKPHFIKTPEGVSTRFISTK
jgi:hypothetical protein